MKPSIYHPRLDVFRDSRGRPVTINDQQCDAILHNMRVWYEIRSESGYWNEQNLASLHRQVEEGNPYGAEITKSVLLRRLLVEGGRPLREPPPVFMAAPQYHQVEGP